MNDGVQHGPALNFRDFVDELLAEGDAVGIDVPVDSDLEAAAITRRVYETHGPAPLFNQVIGAAPGHRLLGAPAGMSRLGNGYGRIARHFGLPRESRPREIVDHLIHAMGTAPIPPREVRSGPVLENTSEGAAVDLRDFGSPLLHMQDGGRYFGTYGMHVVRSPDGTWTSWSISRLMVRDHRSLVGPAMPAQHLGMIHQQWSAMGEATPWAFVLGAPPAAIAAAGMPLAEGVSEDGYVGALAGVPVDVVRTPGRGIPVPANSEIVVEGVIDPHLTDAEGPMGEYHGYQFDDSSPKPVFHVESISHRTQPILPFCVAGMPPEENHTIWGTMISAVATELLRGHGLPVSFAWCTYEAATCWLAVSFDIERLAGMHLSESELAHRVADVLFESHVGWLVPKVLLVGADIDVTDANALLWALATRYRPGTEYVFDDAPGIPLVPYLSDADIAAGRGGKSVMSLLQPEQISHGRTRGIPAQFTTSYPISLQNQVRSRWADYGFRP
ncbi:UbiD family decarboxylase [Tsukamurella asaccharolytica]|uniref:Pyrrole-2-carboxylic acid decarboxylase n=2 Tax=Tsukamurella asaccharolytica TaxID=2592067 RepID=A0A5C5RGA2_9ACTN|nr:UbiD family decarboxylase [Tsukamurella asaccharolytica]